MREEDLLINRLKHYGKQGYIPFTCRAIRD